MNTRHVENLEYTCPQSRPSLLAVRALARKGNGSQNLIFLIECKKCTKQYIGETKRQLYERFGEHRLSIQNYHQLIKPTPVSTHFNQPGHSIDRLLLTPLELIHNTRDSVRKAREAHLINKAMTLDHEPLGINRRDEQN